jgi:hypothetical protein
MSKSPVASRLKRGGFYRDLDGRLVRLVRIERELCTWITVSEPESTQTSHRENFLRRFRSLDDNAHKLAA